MGNSRLGLGLLDVILDAWRFKLNEMKRESRAKTKKNRASSDYPRPASSTKMLPNSPSHPKASGTQFTNSTRKLVTSSVPKLCIHSDDLQQGNITTADISIEVSSKSSLGLKDFVVVSDLKLPPILIGKERYTRSQAKRSPQMPVSSSPRITVKRVLVQNGRRSSGSPTRSRKRLSESFAVVKSSLDPEKDFRESMVEMIVEKDIRAAKDLEELLAWYLTLNTNEYHVVIVKVFQQIWFDLSDFITL